LNVSVSLGTKNYILFYISSISNWTSCQWRSVNSSVALDLF